MVRVKEQGEVSVKQANADWKAGFGSALECEDCHRLFESADALDQHERKHAHGEHRA